MRRSKLNRLDLLRTQAHRGIAHIRQIDAAIRNIRTVHGSRRQHTQLPQFVEMEFVVAACIDVYLLQLRLNSVRRPRGFACAVRAVDRRSVKLGNERKHGVAMTMNPCNVRKFVERAAGQQAVEKP